MAGVKGSREEFPPPLFEERWSVANHTHCWKTTLRRKRGGKEENKDWKRGEVSLKKKRTKMERLRRKAHLIVDIKHSLLNLLVDLLGCVDESLR